MARITVNGKEVEASQIEFTSMAEPWSEIHLEDGTILRQRIITTRVYKLAEKNPEGDTQYHTFTNILQDFITKDKQ